MLLEDLGRCLPAEGLAGPVVERMSHGFEVFGGPARQVGSLGEVLAQQTIDASMSSRLWAPGDLVCPCRLVLVHGSVDDVDEMALEDAASAAGTFDRFVAV